MESMNDIKLYSNLLLPSNTTILTEVRCTVNQYTLGYMFRPVQGHPQAKRTYNDLKNELTIGSHLVKINYYEIYKTYFHLQNLFPCDVNYYIMN
jgi:hypothetical protein